MRTAVAGATGVVGGRVVHHLAQQGHEVVPLARRTGVDVRSGAGLTGRLSGVEVVVDCLGPVTARASESVAFFTATTRHLLEAAERAGVRHHVALSIVGIDRVATGHYAGKLAQEEVLRASARPVTVLRATQFHEFAEQVLDRLGAGPVVLAPRMATAPVAADEVGAALAEIAVGEPARGRLEMGGPETLALPDLVRAVVRRDARRVPVVPLPLPGAAGRAARDGALLPERPWRTGHQTFDRWLATERGHGAARPGEGVSLSTIRLTDKSGEVFTYDNAWVAGMWSGHLIVNPCTDYRERDGLLWEALSSPFGPTVQTVLLLATAQSTRPATPVRNWRVLVTSPLATSWTSTTDLAQQTAP